MMNVVNYMCPFFKDRKPIVGGKVFFVKPDTSALTFDEYSGLDAADYVTVKSYDGTPLENPLPLDSEGAFSVQPFVDDGVDYKMAVFYPTGLPAELHDETPCWGLAGTIEVKSPSMSVTYDGIKSVDSVAELRTTDPELGTVLVLGYYSANDQCPPRMFRWKQGAAQENGGTKIRSSVTGYGNAGNWLFEPEDCIDIRWFGINPAAGEDCTATVNAISAEHQNIPVYFPTGIYRISSSMTIYAAIIDRAAAIRPAESVTNDLYVTIGSLDNRGGAFGANSRDCCAFPIVKGVMYASMTGNVLPIDGALDEAALENVDLLVFDADRTVSSDVTVTGKRVLVKKNVTVDSHVTFENCAVFDENTGNISGIGGGYSVEPFTEGQDNGVKFKHGGDVVATVHGDGSVEFNGFVRVDFGFVIDELYKNFFAAYDSGDQSDDWNGLLRLVAEKAKIEAARIASLALTDGAAARLDVGYLNTPLRKGGYFIVEGGYISKYNFSTKQFETLRAWDGDTAVFQRADFEGDSLWKIFVRLSNNGVKVSLPYMDNTRDDKVLLFAVQGYGHDTEVLNLLCDTNSFKDFGLVLAEFRPYCRFAVRHFKTAESIPFLANASWHIDPFFA